MFLSKQEVKTNDWKDGLKEVEEQSKTGLLGHSYYIYLRVDGFVEVQVRTEMHIISIPCAKAIWRYNLNGRIKSFTNGSISARSLLLVIKGIEVEAEKQNKGYFKRFIADLENEIKTNGVIDGILIQAVSNEKFAGKLPNYGYTKTSILSNDFYKILKTERLEEIANKIKAAKTIEEPNYEIPKEGLIDSSTVFTPLGFKPNSIGPRNRAGKRHNPGKLKRKLLREQNDDFQNKKSKI